MGTRRTASPEAASVAPAVSKNPGKQPRVGDSKATAFSNGAVEAGARVWETKARRPRAEPSVGHPKSRMQARRAMLTLKAALAVCPHQKHGLTEQKCIPCHRMTGAIHALEWVMGSRVSIFSPEE